MANMLIAPNFIYYFEFENGHHVDVLVFVVLFGGSNMVNMLMLSYLLYYLDLIMVRMLIFYNCMYDFGFENGQFVDVIAVVIIFGIRSWPTC